MEISQQLRALADELLDELEPVILMKVVSVSLATTFANIVLSEPPHMQSATIWLPDDTHRILSDEGDESGRSLSEVVHDAEYDMSI